MQELQTTLTLYKNEGETPLECLDRLRVEHPEYKDAVLSYAGRLDPMAEGQLLVLVNEENKKRAVYLNLDKEYEVDILFEVSTDTGDILGKISDLFPAREPFFFLRSSATLTASKEEGFAFSKKITDFLQSFIRKFEQTYPSYSSKTVDGKSLFQWAREKRLNEIEIPKKEVEIYAIDLLNSFEITGAEIMKNVEERIKKVKGDFRQQEIIESWQEAFSGREQECFEGIRIKVSCSSGTYMRSLAENIALKLGTIGLAWRIRRTALLFQGYKVL